MYAGGILWSGRRRIGSVGAWRGVRKSGWGEGAEGEGRDIGGSGRGMVKKMERRKGLGKKKEGKSKNPRFGKSRVQTRNSMHTRKYDGK